MKKKIILTLVFLVVAVGVGYYLLFSNEDNTGNTIADSAFGWEYPVAKFPQTGPGDLAYSDLRDPGGIPEGLPVRLKIPAIGVDSAIEDALITPSGRMDVPAGSKNVAWFALGPHPGRIGSAVIGGHFGIRNNIPFVFYKLDELKVGDKVYIINDKDETLAFIVRSVKLFDRNADATTVFASDDGLAHLNLITCEGVWNRVDGNYPERRVVFTDAIATEKVVPAAPSASASGGSDTKTQDTIIFSRTLVVGSRGADVTTLQTFLSEKGFLIMPSGVSYGYFGPLTSTAVGKYQVSAGLERVGVFGPLTRAKVLAELGGDTRLPNTAGNIESSSLVPTETVASSSDNEDFSSPLRNQTLVEFIKSLFATPLDGIITSSLLLLIAFLILRIIWRS